MIDKRKSSFDNISRILAITRYDIEHHQVINDLSLNIHGENYFRDVFNYVYDYNFENANFESSNIACIDLIDKKRKLAYQITTTRTKEKIENTLIALKKTEYEGYKIKIFYLLDKSKPNNETRDYFKEKYSINITDNLIDYTDLIEVIGHLETNKLIELNNKYFKGKEDKYTDQIVLDLVFRHLIRQRKEIKKDYDDDFGTIDSNQKLTLNNINTRISGQINIGLDYTKTLDNINEDNLLTDLRGLIINNYYKNILLAILETKISKSELKNKKLPDLHNLSEKHKLDFNRIINKLHEEIESYVEINDFNSMNIAWIIIAYFFEICDVGIHKP